MKTIVNEKSFNANIKAISVVSEKLAQNIHEAGLFALQQANIHGNIGFGQRLVDAMGKKHDAQRVVSWLVFFGKFGVKDGKLVFRKRKDITEANVDAMLDKAEATPYWEHTPQKTLVERVDYLSMLSSIVNKHKAAIKKQESGEVVEEKNLGVVAEVEKLLAKFKTTAQPADNKIITV